MGAASVTTPRMPDQDTMTLTFQLHVEKHDTEPKSKHAKHYVLLSTWSWKVSVIVSWSGMRGVVTLAAPVFVLPTAHSPGALLTLAAFTVVAGTLLIQGLSLPWLVRRLALPGPDIAEDALQAAGLVNTANAGLAVLAEVTTDDDPPEVLEALRDRAMYAATASGSSSGARSRRRFGTRYPGS